MLRRTFIQNTKRLDARGLLDRPVSGPSPGNPLRSSNLNRRAAHVELPTVRIVARPADTFRRSTGLDQWSPAGTSRTYRSGTVHTSRHALRISSTPDAEVVRADGTPRRVFDGHGCSPPVLRARGFA